MTPQGVSNHLVTQLRVELALGMWSRANFRCPWRPLIQSESPFDRPSAQARTFLRPFANRVISRLGSECEADHVAGVRTRTAWRRYQK